MPAGRATQPTLSRIGRNRIPDAERPPSGQHPGKAAGRSGNPSIQRYAVGPEVITTSVEVGDPRGRPVANPERVAQEPVGHRQLELAGALSLAADGADEPALSVVDRDPRLVSEQYVQVARSIHGELRLRGERRMLRGIHTTDPEALAQGPLLELLPADQHR